MHDTVVPKTRGNRQQRVRAPEQGDTGKACLSVLTGGFPGHRARLSHTLENLLAWTICSSMQSQRPGGQQTPRISGVQFRRVRTGKEQNG